MNLENIMISERIQKQKVTYVRLHLYEMSRTSKSTEIESKLVVFRDLEKDKMGSDC